MVEAVVVPSLPTVLWLTLLAIPASWSMVVPLSACLGVALGMQRWREEGGWVALQTCDLAGRTFIRPIAQFGLWVMLMTSVSGMWIEPWSRSASRAIYSDAVSSMMLIENQPVTLGEQVLVAGKYANGWYEDVMIHGPGSVTYATRGRVVDVGDAFGVELINGSLVSLQEPSWRVLWSRWVIELPPGISARVELNERTVIALWQQAARTESSGGDAAYEWAVAYKRFVHPLCAALLVVGVLPLGMLRSPGLAVGVVAVGYVAAVRVGDGLVPGLGASLGAGTGLLFSAVFAAGAWWAWRDA